MKIKHKLIILSVALIYSLPNNYKQMIINHHRENVSHANHSIITHVTLTCYQPVVSQCNSDPLTTADGSRINLKHLKRNEIKWCAISRDLLYMFPKGKPRIINIDGYGKYEVRDIMNKRHHHRVDILQHPSNSRLILKMGVKIEIL